MKCALVTKYGARGDYDEMLVMSEECDKPQAQAGFLVLRVQAACLAPGDVRVASGWTTFVQTPPGGLPYVPGGDVVGVVVEEDQSARKFKLGDCVVARFHGNGPHGALAEFARVKSSLAAVKPVGISTPQAAAIPSSPVVALRVAQAWVKPGDRCLVIGGTGGVGSHLVQLLKGAGASYVAATASTQNVTLLETALRSSVDRAIDREKENFWEIAEFKSAPFDVLFDLAAPSKVWLHALAVLKSGWQGGRFVTLVGPEFHYKMQSAWQVLRVAKRVALDGFGTWLRPWLPRYSWWLGGLDDPIEDETWQRVFDLVRTGELRIILDPEGPFPFSEQGVRDAFRLQATRHARGKVVVAVDDFAGQNDVRA